MKHYAALMLFLTIIYGCSANDWFPLSNGSYWIYETGVSYPTGTVFSLKPYKAGLEVLLAKEIDVDYASLDMRQALRIKKEFVSNSSAMYFSCTLTSHPVVSLFAATKNGIGPTHDVTAYIKNFEKQAFSNFSDIVPVTWKETVKKESNGYRVVFDSEARTILNQPETEKLVSRFYSSDFINKGFRVDLYKISSHENYDMMVADKRFTKSPPKYSSFECRSYDLNTEPFITWIFFLDGIGLYYTGYGQWSGYHLIDYQIRH